MATKIRIGSRPSRLALVQADLVKHQLQSLLPGVELEVVPLRTTGDRMTRGPLAEIGGKGLFIRELEQALSDRRVDIAVHSMKDLPARIAPEYQIVAVPRREDPRDVLVTRQPGGIAALAPQARAGTSSPRRRFELARMRPDLEILNLRGNVDTRLARLEVSGPDALDAVILAMAGLKRLDRLDGLNAQILDERDFVPAGGQGALAIEALANEPVCGSSEIDAACRALDDESAMRETAAERAFLATIGASCVSPVGVKGSASGEGLMLRALIFGLDGSGMLADEIQSQAKMGGREDATSAGIALGERMLAKGADALIGHG